MHKPPPAHHPQCTCDIDFLNERVVTTANEVADLCMQVSTSHQLCSHNRLVVAYFLIEYMRDAFNVKQGSEEDVQAEKVAKDFYKYSAAIWESSNMRRKN